jgi:hypothetical protein
LDDATKYAGIDFFTAFNQPPCKLPLLLQLLSLHLQGFLRQTTS